ncbi:MAG: hypothetical protein FWD61_11640 [Phycisphaerales bacterium]|nr:hypothetical protein [Phycisphaerales bacterium]
MQLPPIGTPLEEISGEIITKVILLKQESRLVRHPWEMAADINRNYYHYNAMEPAADGVIVCNDIQQNVITQTDLQTKDAPVISFEAIDTGERPRGYLDLEDLGIPPAVLAQQFQLAPNEVAPWVGEDGETHPPTHLSRMSVMKVQNAIKAGLLPPDVLISVSAGEREDLIQKVFDTIWRRSRTALWFTRHVLKNNVDGWCTVSYEFDDAKKKFLLTDIPLKQVFADPTDDDEEKWAYFIVDLPFDAQIAKGLNPELADEIDEYADPIGKIVRPPETLEMGSKYEDLPSINRPFITLTEVFLRDQECFMRPEQAIEAGHFHEREVGTGDWVRVASDEGATGEGGGQGDKVTGGQGKELDAPGELQEQMRTGYFTGDDPNDTEAEEVYPPGHERFDAKRWPTYRCIRHITLVASRSVVLADRPCQYQDFPAALNQCIPVLDKPFGIGEPFRHRPKQDARTRLMTNAVDHSEWFKGPMTWGPKSARDQYVEDYGDAFARPNRHMWLPDDLILKTNGKPMGTQDPPAMPPVLLQLDEKLKREINDDSGNMAALQGRPADAMSNLSGVAIGLIQSAAASMASFKANRMSHVMERIARLGLHSILTRMTAADVYKIVKKYPIHVLEALWAGAVEMEWETKIVLSAGASASQDKKQADALTKFQLGLTSQETTRDRTGEDNSLETRRINEEKLRDLQLQTQAQASMQSPPPSPPQPTPAGGPPAAGFQVGDRSNAVDAAHRLIGQ